MTAHNLGPAWLSIDELAEHLCSSKATIYSWNRRRNGPAYIRLDGRCLYHIADVERWRDERRGRGR